MKITNKEFYKISRVLESKNVLFSKFWELGEPIFSKMIETACVTFDKEGKQRGFYFNPDFWDKSSFYKRLFILSHEMLHCILNHGVRFKEEKYRQASNVAMDIVVNHLLTSKFGFSRKRVEGSEELCWVDTVFKDEKVSTQHSFEFYFNKIKEKMDRGDYKRKVKVRFGNGDGKGEQGEFEFELPNILDDHNGLDEETSKKIIEELNKHLSDEEKNELKGMIEKHYQKDEEDKKKESTNQKAGTGTGGWFFIDIKEKIVKKRKWETVIKKWALKHMKDDFKSVEQWARDHRRLMEIKDSLGENVLLPNEQDIEDLYQDKKKINVIMALDSSGSCWDLKDRFFTAASTLPTDVFELHLLTFDTVCYETTLKSGKIYGGGGTAFQPVEDFVQKMIKDKKWNTHPTIFILTDGYGTEIKTKSPHMWYWFLTKGGSTEYIPKESKIYNLEDYE